MLDEKEKVFFIVLSDGCMRASLCVHLHECTTQFQSDSFSFVVCEWCSRCLQMPDGVTKHKNELFEKKENFESENCFQISGILPNSAINYVQLVLVFWNFFHVDPLGVYEISININCRDPVNIFRRDLFMAGGRSPTPEHVQLFLLHSEGK